MRWGLPVAATVSDLAAVTTLGLLGLSAFLVPERRDTTRRVAANRLAAVTATVWATAGGLVVLLSFADLAGLPLSDPDYLHQLFRFVLELEVTRVALISAGIAMVVAVGSALATRRAPTAWLALATRRGDRPGRVDRPCRRLRVPRGCRQLLGVHLLGVSVWVGGLIALVILRSRLGRDLGVTVARYSTLAGWAFTSRRAERHPAGVAAGGLARCVRGHGIGRVVLVKAAALVGLGVAGYYQRRNLSTRLQAAPADGRAFARLAGGEVVVMALAVGLAVALSRSAPPVPDALPNPSRILALTMFPDPGPMTTADWVTAWRMDWLLLALAVVAVGLYAAGVRRLRRRGDSWPWGRTVSWVCGWLVWVYATCGAPDIWGRVLFSVHMVVHMTIAMIVPILLVPGAPITLLLRALPARPGQDVGAARGLPACRAVTGAGHPRQPGRRVGAVLPQPRGLLLLPVVLARPDDALRALHDDAALHRHGVPLRPRPSSEPTRARRGGRH